MQSSGIDCNKFGWIYVLHKSGVILKKMNHLYKNPCLQEMAYGSVRL